VHALCSAAPRRPVGAAFLARSGLETSRGDSASVAAIIDGNFDKSGLPNPLVLTFYFSVGGSSN
jgi:hypothetical protein